MFKRFIYVGLALLFSFLALLISSRIDAASFDYRNYESILHHHLKPGVVIDGIRVTAVDYAALEAEARQTGSGYNTLLKDLALFYPETLDGRQDRMAFWINIYNITAIKTIVDHYPVDSIRSRKINWLGLPWDRKAITVGGKEYSLGQIENALLLDLFQELRIHFGINCASVSCVDLASDPYRGESLIHQLEGQGRRFLADPQRGFRIDRRKKVISLSQVFKFDRKHFDNLGGGSIHFILPFLRPEDREWIEKEQYSIDYLNYDWKTNDLKNVR